MNKKSITDLLIYIISAELIGSLSALFSGGYYDFFEIYQKPPLMPPMWIFPVVWVILYAVMGISAYMIHSTFTNSDTKKRAMLLYWLQLFVNFSWSIVFFRFELLWVSVAVILLLWILIIAMIISFYRINNKAGLINIPYLIWVTFAAYLNIAIAVINA